MISTNPGESFNPAPPPGDVSQVVEHLFRHEAGKMLSSLTRAFGFENLSLAEDVVQEALVRALQTWPWHGIPKNPAAWLMQVAKNLALDKVRRDKVFRGKETEVAAYLESRSVRDDGSLGDEEINDDRLRMMFVCCHPVVAPEAQVALALKTLCGFSVEEIARAFLTTPAAIAKRLTRARQKIREADIPFEVPQGEELAARLRQVLQSIYLLFNEGYKASSGDRLVREELCFEAIRLAVLLAENPAGNRPETHALVALMLLNGARLPARTDADGNLLRLRDQDRTRWDRAMIARGMFHFARSASGEELTRYHLEAAIAACHSSASDYGSTDWPRILSLYDRLVAFDDSPVVALNRAIAVAQVHGAAAGLEAIHAIGQRDTLDSYYLFHAVLGDFELQLNRPVRAAAHFRKALDLTEIHSEQRFLADRIRACEDQAPL